MVNYIIIYNNNISVSSHVTGQDPITPCSYYTITNNLKIADKVEINYENPVSRNGLYAIYLNYVHGQWPQWRHQHLNCSQGAKGARYISGDQEERF